MWPLEVLRKRRYNRRYKAAMVVLLGAHMVERLDPEDRARVELELTENFKRSLEPPAAWKRWARDDVIAAFRAAAMERAGIQPVVVGLSWSELFKPWNFWRKWPQWPMRGFDNRPAWLVFDYRAFDQATADASAYLKHNGLLVPDLGP